MDETRGGPRPGYRSTPAAIPARSARPSRRGARAGSKWPGGSYAAIFAACSLGEERCRKIAFAKVGQNDDHQFAGIFGLRSATWIAANAAAPHEIPQSIPSSRASRRDISNASSSRTVITSSMIDALSTSGMNPAPIP